MNNKVIFTALIGKYDHLPQPKVYDKSFDYICFTKNPQKNKLGIWEIKNIDYYNLDKTRIARYIKTHPETLLKDYKYTVWIDSNIVINGNLLYERVNKLISQKKDFAAIKHPTRDCIYIEAFEVLKYAKDSFSKVIEQVKFLKKEKYPQHNGLCETNLLYRNINSKKNVQLDNYWWKIIDKYSKRDQMAFNYALWKLNIKYDDLLGDGITTRNNKNFESEFHLNDMKIFRKVKVKIWYLFYSYKFLLPIYKKIFKLN
jgi:hypothetical protein